MKGGTSQNLSSFYFHNSCFYVEIMTQKYSRTYKVTLIVKQGSHGLYINKHKYANIKYTSPEETPFAMLDAKCLVRCSGDNSEMHS